MSTTRTPAAKATPMCVVTIGGLLNMVLPLEKGLSLVRLLSGACEVEPQWNVKAEYLVRRPVTADFRTVTPDQIIVPPAPTPAGVAQVNTVRRLKYDQS